MSRLLETLQSLKLVRDAAAARALVPAGERPEVSLLRLCDGGQLVGGLSVSLGVRPDELVGPLTLAMGGAARGLRVLDVRERPVLELQVMAGTLTERWEVEDLYALVHNLNDLYRDAADTARIAVLSEWEDALQLWCVPRTALARLLQEPFFQPQNRRALLPAAAR
ncbi:hypothetical protein FGE12_25775 [Aggregicoccus sp. 17bor-14]|uniref:hypothetical protein n=1 Tax=Myxococcaceae TaxID=31 RepID=UPI00129C2FD5|nr:MULTISPECIES: hypothetical protein [Myxococcaceae]MBF5045845.1 hypothetical protein [Simulacricoccus sp. 17bor-14]MRI91579.1 hypothetical protein [Aggregicoccus sp. 17bor-14]